MNTGVKRRALGASRAGHKDQSVVGLGTFAMGGWYWGGTDERKAIEAIQASIDLAKITRSTPRRPTDTV